MSGENSSEAVGVGHGVVSYPDAERTCGLVEDHREDEVYNDTCEAHPNGCHVVIVEPGVELHEKPAYNAYLSARH